MWLNLPAAVCAARAAARVDHEGGLQGPAARSAKMSKLCAGRVRPLLMAPGRLCAPRTRALVKLCRAAAALRPLIP